MIRILHIYPQLNNAGTEMVIMNLYKNINRKQVQFDFLVQKKGELDKSFRDMGAHIFYISNEGEYSRALLTFYKEHAEYQIIHTHTHQEMGMVLKMAAKTGIPYRIAHSHNYRGDVPKFMRYYKMIKSWDIETYATHLIACSEEAAAWLFPRTYKKCAIWNNAIDLQAFSYNDEIRKEYRNKFQIPENAKVICHVGRFAEQKNHKRIVTLLNKLIERDEKIYGILVGVGPLHEEMKGVANSEQILFVGNRTDVPSILCAADVFLFPSLYEGLGIVAVEAQANGLMCISSTNVPKAADIGTNSFFQIPLEEKDEVWIMEILRVLQSCNHNERINRSKASLMSHYNIKRVAEYAQNFYLTLK